LVYEFGKESPILVVGESAGEVSGVSVLELFLGMKIRGGLTIFLQKQAIKGVVYFKQGKVLEVFGYAFNREGFFIESFVPDLVAPAGNSFFIPLFRINLPNPPSISVTGRSDEDIRIEISK